MKVASEPREQIWHQGEKELQRRFGRSDRLDEIGANVLRDHMPDQHREFFAALETVHIAALDREGHPWAFMRMGQAGFMHSPDPKTLIVNSHRLAGEPDDLQLTKGKKISLVGIEFHSRRRNRLNAVIANSTESELVLNVDQSFGNCPKYIQTRDLMFRGLPTRTEPRVSTSDKLTLVDAELASDADTLFIASRSAIINSERFIGVDINHRGGHPGFLNILDTNTLEFPDYVGNNFFNTLGNIAQDPRVTLQIVLHELGTLLTLKGKASLQSYGETDASAPHTDRKVRFEIQRVVRAENALPVESDFDEYSPMLPDRG